MTYVNRTIVVQADSRYLTQRVVEMIGEFDAAMENIGTIEEARDEAVQAAEDASAVTDGVRIPPYQPFTARSLAEAATIPVDLAYLNVAGQYFRKDVAGTALTTADGATWTPAGVVTPFHFGAVPNDMDNDQSAAFNALSSWLRTQYSTAAGCFTNQIDLCGLAWRVDSWNLTNIRQPAFSFGNGTIVSFGTGRTAIDCAGTNHARIIGELSIEAPIRDQAPAVGMCIGRALSGGDPAPIAPDWSGRVRIDGYYSKSGFVNIASEVSNLELHITNRHRSLNSVCLAHVGHMGTLDEFMGGLTSEYVTLPTAATGNMSNILHHYARLVCKHSADVALPILGITQANPCVVTVDPTALTNAQLTAGATTGTPLWFHDHGGMPQLKHRRVRVAAQNLTTGQITLSEVDGSPVNSTAYGAWTGGGRVWSSTGPAAVFGGGVNGVEINSSYFLTYGEDTIIFDCSRGSSRNFKIDFQQEASPPSAIRFHTGAENCLLQDIKINILSASQELPVSACRVTTGGTLRIDGLDFTIGSYPGAPGGAVWSGISVVSIRNGRLRYPWGADAQFTGWDAFSGVIEVMDWNMSQSLNYDASGDRSTAVQCATAGQLNSISSEINTRSKFVGKEVFDTTNNRLVYAVNSAPGSVWKFGDTLANTPV